jgi:hypothetical protein
MLADTLRALGARRVTDPEGGRAIELLPPATPDQIARVVAAAPAPLPAEVREALQVSTGLATGPLESFSLVDLEGFGLEEAFPCPWSIAHDGNGNYWILDLLPDSYSWGPVFFACHDPPVIAWQSASLDDFLRDVIALWESPGESSVARVREEAVHRIWREHPDTIAPSAAQGGSDPLLRGFAAALPAGAVISDLRRATLGQGFAWGRFGPRTIITRADRERIWAVQPPERRPGLLQRLFGSHS